MHKKGGHGCQLYATLSYYHFEKWKVLRNIIHTWEFLYFVIDDESSNQLLLTDMRKMVQLYLKKFCLFTLKFSRLIITHRHPLIASLNKRVS